MFRTVISFTPFMVCLFWFIIFALRYRRNNQAKGESFSDFINSLRIEDAKSILDKNKSVKLLAK